MKDQRMKSTVRFITEHFLTIFPYCNFNDFYSISIEKNKIQLQGENLQQFNRYNDLIFLYTNETKTHIYYEHFYNKFDIKISFVSVVEKNKTYTNQ